MSKIRLKYDIIAQRAVDTESGVNIDEALRRRKVEIQNISNSLNQTNYEVQELGETVTSAAAIAASMEGRLSAVEDDVDDLTNEKMDKSSSADFYPRYSNPEGYLTSANLDRYATKEYVEENTSAFLTSADLSNYATEQWVEEQDYLTSADLDDYVTDQYLENELEPYATSAWVEANFQPSGDYVTEEDLDDSLDDYYKKNETSGKDELSAEFSKYQPSGHYVTSASLDDKLHDYATSAWVESQGYLTSVPEEYVTDSELTTVLADYAEKTDVEESIASATSALMPKSSSADFYPSSNPSAFIDASYLNDYATETYVDTGLGNTSAWAEATFASASQLDDYYLASNPSGYITESDLVQADWTEDDTTSKSYIQNKPAPLSLQGDSGIKVTETENTLVISVSADYATKGYIDDGLADKVDKVTGMGLSHEDFTSAYKDKLDTISPSAEANVQSDWNVTDSASDSYIKNKPVDLVSDSAYVHTDNNYTNADKSVVDFASEVIPPSASSSNKLATMNDITIAGGGAYIIEAEFDGSEISCPTTFAEVKSAWDADKTIYLRVFRRNSNDYQLWYLVDYNPESDIFTFFFPSDNQGFDASQPAYYFIWKYKMDKEYIFLWKNCRGVTNFWQKCLLLGVDLNWYVSKQEFISDTSAFITSADLDQYPTTSEVLQEIDEATSGKMNASDSANFYPMDTNPSGYLTSEDLDDYATKEYVTSSTSAFVTSDDLEGILADYKTAAEVDDEFRDTSAWAEATFASAAQLASYATIEDLNDGLDEKLDKTASADFYTIDNPSGFITSEALEGYATEEYVQSQTSGLQPSGDYATKGWVEDQDYLTEVPDTYAESAWVAANFASAAQLSDYATSQDLEDGLAEKLDKTASAEFYPMDTNPSGYLVSSDLSTYATQEYVQQETSGKVDAVEGKGLSTNDYTDADKDVVALTSAVIPAGTDASNQLVNELGLATAMADFGGFKKSTPDASGKPTESDPSTKIIYLTYNDSATGPDKYNEWIWDSAGNDYELIGDTSLDLNGYATEDYVIEHTSGKLDKSTSGQFYLASNPAGFIDSTALEPYALTSYVDAGLGNKLDTSATSAYAESAWVAANFQPVGDYATTEYVDSKTSAFITSAALDPYAEKTYVEEGLATKLDSSAMSAYAESAWVDQNFQRKDDYVTETKLETELTNTSAWAEATFASASQLSSYATTQDLEDGLAEKLDKSESANYYPTTNPSAFIDATYLNGYATEEYVQSQTSGLQPSGNYATQEWVGEQGYLTEVPSDYAQSAWVAANFASASQLSDYYLASNPDHFVTSGELSTVSSQIVSQIPSLEGYATSAWVEEQGYLTEIPSEYVTETEMGTAIESATSGKADKSEIPDVSDFVTQEDIDKATSGKMEKSQSADFYPMATNPSGYLTEHQDLTDYATKQYVTDNTSAFITSSYLDPYAKTSELAAVSAEIMNEMPSIEGLAQEDWVKANFASAAQLDEKLDKTASADFYPANNPSGFLTSDDVAQSDWTETDSADPAYIKNKPAALSMAAGEGIQIVESNNTITFSVSGDYAERSDLDDYYPTTNPSGFLTEVPAEYVTDTELQTVLDDYVTSAWVLDQLDDKVDKVDGMGLSHVDFTSAYQNKLDHIEASANKNVQSDWTESDSASDAFIKNKPQNLSIVGGEGISVTESLGNLEISVSADYATENYVQQETSGKADKASNATQGHLAALSSDGNLLDSTYSPASFATSAQGAKADTAVQDANYVHTDNNYTTTEKNLLDSLDNSVSAIEEKIPTNATSQNKLVTRSDLDAAITGAFEVVPLDANEQPDVAYPNGKTIYLTKDTSLQVTDPYTEWIWLSGTSTFEVIGETTIDLTDYATQNYVQQQTSGKVDKVTGMGLSHVDFTSAYQSKLDSIEASAEVNVQSDWNVTNSALDSYIANKPDIIIPQVGAGVTDVPKYIMVVTAMPPDAQIDPNTIYLVQGTYIGT